MEDTVVRPRRDAANGVSNAAFATDDSHTPQLPRRDYGGDSTEGILGIQNHANNHYDAPCQDRVQSPPDQSNNVTYGTKKARSKQIKRFFEDACVLLVVVAIIAGVTVVTVFRGQALLANQS